MGKRVIFTGGSGQIGRHVVPYLLSQGHEVLNLDRVRLDLPGVTTVATNLEDSGETFNALSSSFGFEDYFRGERQPVDALVHFAAIPRIFIRPDNAVFSANVLSTYHVLEAATKLGIRKVVVASSETVYGICFAQGDRPFRSFPLDEDYAPDPTDSYGLSKVVGETIARSFAARSGADIYVLRIGAITEPGDYARFPLFLDRPEIKRRDAWTHMDVRDLAQIVELCLAKDGLGFQVFNAVNDRIIARLPTAEFLARHEPGVPVRRPMGEFEGPISNRKAKELLGFVERHDWRDYLPATAAT